MHLLLIRHGESVDNVAGLFAGSRDSPLTNHGVLQTKRLGAYLASRCDVIGPVTLVFTSNLQRAYQTAEAVAKAQAEAASSLNKTGIDINVVQLPDLREKDFGSSEGMKYGSKSKSTPIGTVQVDSESHEAMMVRVNRFIDTHLISVFEQKMPDNGTVVIVAHGIILHVLLKALLTRFPPKPTSTDQNTSVSAEFLAAWSNTGVLQAKVEEFPATLDQSTPEQSSSSDQVLPEPTLNTPQTPNLSRRQRVAILVQFSNNLDHLAGLKKTRGGIGSAVSDARQRTLTSFFTATVKKRKADDDG
ncbi:histidine phosphatase superfamily [Xylariales sp. AK1849]|nr:histidine phosphatase superfamily [Xylariales sp. AK1849]